MKKTGSVLLALAVSVCGGMLGAINVRAQTAQDAAAVRSQAAALSAGLADGVDFDGYIVSLRVPRPGEMRAFSYGAEPMISMGQAEQAASLEPVVPEDGLFVTQDVEKTLREIPASVIEYIEPNYYVALFAQDGAGTAPDDTYYNRQWDFAAIDALKFMTKETYPDMVKPNGEKVRVAVVDTGINGALADFDHQRDGLNNGRFLNTPEGNTQQEAKIGQPEDSAQNQHGTCVSGILAAETFNGSGIASLGGNVELYVANSMDSKRSTTSHVAQGIYWAIKEKVDVINLSLGIPVESKILGDAVAAAVAEKMIVVAAVGNEATKITNGWTSNPGVNYLSYPAHFPGVIGVGAIDRDLSRASFSHYNASVDVVAPGMYQWGANQKGSEEYGIIQGTSFATPMVSAVAAMCRAKDPNLDSEGFLNLLKFTSKDLGEPGRDDHYGWGLIQAEKLLSQTNPSYMNPMNFTGDTPTLEGGLELKTVGIPVQNGQQTETVLGKGIDWGEDGQTLQLKLKQKKSSDEQNVQTTGEQSPLGTAVIAEYDGQAALINYASEEILFDETGQMRISYQAKAEGNTIKIYVLGKAYEFTAVSTGAIVVPPAAQGGSQ